MRGQIWTPLLLFLSLLPGIAPAQAEPLPLKPDAAVSGWVVLRNGSMLQGTIHRTAEHYHVQMKKGSLRISADQVEMFCHTKEQAYQRRRELRTGSSADSHLELMRWCLRHKLFEYAARELVDARRIDSEHPSLPMLQRQLQQALRTASPTLQPPKLALSVSEPSSSDSSTAVSPISHTARAEFVRRIQPILIRSCTTAGCHASGTLQKFRLNRHVLAGSGHPEATRRNLASTLAWCRGSKTDEFELLNKAQQSHGKSQPLSARQIELLTAWLEKIRSETEKPEEREEKKEGESFWPSSTAFPHRKPRQDSVRLRGESSKVRHGVQLRTFQPRDPFDAEAFNRHYEQAGD